MLTDVDVRILFRESASSFEELPNVEALPADVENVLDFEALPTRCDELYVRSDGTRSILGIRVHREHSNSARVMSSKVDKLCNGNVPFVALEPFVRLSSTQGKSSVELRASSVRLSPRLLRIRIDALRPANIT